MAQDARFHLVLQPASCNVCFYYLPVTHLHTNTHTHAHTHAHVYTHTHTRLHTHTHTHTHHINPRYLYTHAHYADSICYMHSRRHSAGTNFREPIIRCDAFELKPVLVPVTKPMF